MAPSVHMVLLLTFLLNLSETPVSAPAHRGRGGWTLNSAGYLLGPVLHISPKADQGRKRESAREILDLWKAIDGLPYSHTQRASKRTLMDTFAKLEIRGVDNA
uniref:Galanin-like peptide n=1 Tax=Castor canadensis TaxID=51338 RepID=A0A8B7WH95_CASCN|nr:galanin-like peptide [Castor canadensis]